MQMGTEQILFEGEAEQLAVSWSAGQKPVKLDQLVDLTLEQERQLCWALGQLWPNLQKTESTRKLPKWLDPKNLQDEQEELTFFGGSFDPWHEGHSECLRQCPDQKIVVFPDANPQKQRNQLIRPWTKILELAQKLRPYQVSLYTAFCGQQKANPTAHWIPQVKIQKKNFLMGDDQFLSIQTWVDYEKLLLSLNKLLVVPRIYSLEESEKKAQELRIKFPQLEIKILSPHHYQTLSSTNLR